MHLLVGVVVCCIAILCRTEGRYVHSNDNSSTHPHARHLGDNACFNFEFSFQPSTWNESFMHQTPARLFLNRIWHPSTESDFELTVVTHLSPTRLFQLEAQCSAWEGPFVAAIYVSILQPLDGKSLDPAGRDQLRQAKAQLSDLHARVEGRPGCKLTIMLMWEVISGANLTLLYPYNDLRNAAILQVKTPLVAMLDVDLVMSSNLNEEMKDPAKVAKLKEVCAQRSVVVLPAFELPVPPLPEGENVDATALEDEQLVAMQQLCAEALTGGKAKVVEMYKQGTIESFAGKRFPRGHNNTNYPRWMEAQELYSTTYQWEYEPWFIVDRRLNWWYDARYRAWFFDKALQVGSMVWRDRFNIMVHPSAFLVHRPHSKPPVMRDPEVFQSVLRWMKPRAGLSVIQMMEGSYKARINAVVQSCLLRLPWWKVDPNDSEYWDKYSVTRGEPVNPTWV